MISFWTASDKIVDKVYIPKFYNPEIIDALTDLEATHQCFTIQELVENGSFTCSTGDEIGKLAYGTGSIPFVRTSDIANWEIKTAPKQGISREIFDEYRISQDVIPGDILFVRDGTYLIGNSCFITPVDKELLFQSHIIKIRVNAESQFDSALIFLALNSPIVQKQIRSFQFTADIIDTIGQRFYQIVLPLPKRKEVAKSIIGRTKKALLIRSRGKAFIKQAGILIEKALLENSVHPLENFMSQTDEEIAEQLTSETVTNEFGGFQAFWLSKDSIKSDIYLPKYYDPSIKEEIERLSKNCDFISMGMLKENGVVDYYTGDEIGKMAYGTGTIPFIRTSDFTNWEISSDPKQGVSETIYAAYSEKENVEEEDIFLVRDGTYLVGNSCIVTKYDEKCLYCGGLYKIRVLDKEKLNPYLLLALLNSYIVKRQIRTKQFTRDVIDTIGHRIDEVLIPIPKSSSLRKNLSSVIKNVIQSRISAREEVKALSRLIVE